MKISTKLSVLSERVVWCKVDSDRKSWSQFTSPLKMCELWRFYEIIIIDNIFLLNKKIKNESISMIWKFKKN